MGKIVVLAEKADVATRIAATLGDCYINGTKLKPDMVDNKKYDQLIRNERRQKGHFTAVFQGDTYLITWAMGHLGTLKQAKEYDPKYRQWKEAFFPIIPEEYEIKLMDNPHIKSHFKLLKKWFAEKDTDLIIDATDADREGTLIFDYVYRLTGSDAPYKQLWINSYTEEAVVKGFQSLRDASAMQPLLEAARCRAIADWVVGANLTSMATLKFGGYKNMVSLGRVQTPTLTILVEREKEILNFKPEAYFELVATFQKENGEIYEGKWKKGKTDRFDSKEKANKALKEVQGQQGAVVDYKENTYQEDPPLLYDLTALQMDANAQFGYSLKKTLEIAQKLYEKQFITYPRTSSRYLPEDIKNDMKRVIESLPERYNPHRDTIAASRLSFPKRFFNDKKVESHYAIIPTYKKAEKLNQEEESVYDLIVRSFLRIFMEKAKWAQTKIQTEVKGHVFHTSGKMLLEEGWRALDTKKRKEDGELPKLTKQEKVKTEKASVLSKKTKPPNRYTEKTLVSMMETAGKLVEDEELREAMKDHGIGTSATRGDILEKLIRVGYIERKGKTIFPTEKGIKVIDTLPVEDIKSPSMTGDWEYKLNQIEKQQYNAEAFVKEIESFTRQQVETLKTYSKQEIVKDKDKFGDCPLCSAPIVKNKKGWGCSRWKSGCKFQIWDNEICKKRLTDANIRQLLKKGETNEIKGFTSKKGKSFNAKMELEKGSTGKLNFKF